MPIIWAFKIVLLPFKLILSLFGTGGTLTEEDKRIARSERMSYDDYIEAEERDDDNLDTDD